MDIEKNNRKYAIWISALSVFLIPFLGSSLIIALPQIGKDFGLSAVEMTWISTGYILSAAVCLVPFGRLADIYGRKKIFRIGIMIEVIACLMAMVAPSGRFLIMLRVFQGMSGAMIWSTGIAIITSVYPLESRGKMLGINVATVYSGLSLGPVLGGFLTHQIGWRSIFFLNVILGVIIIYLVTTKLMGEWKEAEGETFDKKGTIAYAITVVFVMYGLTILPTATGIILMGLGFVVAGYFIYRELHVEHPVLELRLFRRTSFTLSNLAALISYSATFSVGFLLSLYLQYIQGFNPQTAGFVLLCQPILMAVVSPLAGRLSDRIEARFVASLGMAFTVIGLFIFIFLKMDMHIFWIVIGLISLGFGFGLFSSPNTNAIMSSVEKRFYGTASGIVSTMRSIGQVFSMGITTMIFHYYLGDSPIQPSNYPEFLTGTRIGFVLFTALCFVGIFASLARGKILNSN